MIKPNQSILVQKSWDNQHALIRYHISNVFEVQGIDNIYYETEYRREWCRSQGMPSKCFLFARKFTRAAVMGLLNTVTQDSLYLFCSFTSYAHQHMYMTWSINSCSLSIKLVSYFSVSASYKLKNRYVYSTIHLQVWGAGKNRKTLREFFA